MRRRSRRRRRTIAGYWMFFIMCDDAKLGGFLRGGGDGCYCLRGGGLCVRGRMIMRY